MSVGQLQGMWIHAKGFRFSEKIYIELDVELKMDVTDIMD
jgi:hypothetical protein